MKWLICLKLGEEAHQCLFKLLPVMCLKDKFPNTPAVRTVQKLHFSITSMDRFFLKKDVAFGLFPRNNLCPNRLCIFSILSTFPQHLMAFFALSVLSCFTSVFFGVLSKNGMAELYHNSKFNHLRNHHTVFKSGYTILYSHQQCIRVPIIYLLINTCYWLLFCL